MEEVTPAMRQYHKIKKQNPGCIVLFQLGDFYEALYDDAKTVSRVLNIVLTARNKRGERVPMAGVPIHAIDTYLPKIVNAGYKVALVAQTEPPSVGKKIVNREVLRVSTPGTLTDDTQVGSKTSRYIAAVCGSKNWFSIAYAEASSGEFKVSKKLSLETISQLIETLQVKELVVSEGMRGGEFLLKLAASQSLHLTKLDSFTFDPEVAGDKLKSHFGASKLRGFGLEKEDLASISAAGALLQYLENTQKTALEHITQLSIYYPEKGLMLDQTTIRNLELIAPLFNRDGPSLLSTLDNTKTAMGGRLIREWIVKPLAETKAINQRLDAVDTMHKAEKPLETVPTLLSEISDTERIVGKLGLQSIRPPHLPTLSHSLQSAQELSSLINKLKRTQARKISLLASIHRSLSAALKQTAPLVKEINKAILEQPAAVLHSGHIFQEGYNKELDQFRKAAEGGKNWIRALETKERKRTGVSSLKVRYNKVFGYYIEISKANMEKAPKSYIRKQTLVNAERFITPELKDMEAKLLGAEERMIELEDELFGKLLEKIKRFITPLQQISKNIAVFDVLYGFAETAKRKRYVRPQVSAQSAIEIKRGRHPVVETICEKTGEPFIPNDTAIGRNNDQIVILTGPNMGGKSTYIRQVALIVIMAQLGSFVPADSAKIGVVDRLFARVGASDNLAFGESTFMVEMLESANILNHATSHSLVILDEVGRGTSTYDGMSLAWAIVEYLHENVGCKTLFATHYHELTALEKTLKRVKNYQVAAKDDGEKVLFLRKVLRGKADQSYGIHVAKLAGVPARVVTRAKELLSRFEKGRSKATQVSLPLVVSKTPLEVRLKELDIENMTPLEALKTLAELKAQV